MTANAPEQRLVPAAGGLNVQSVATTGGSPITLAGQLGSKEWKESSTTTFVYTADSSAGTVSRPLLTGCAQEVFAKGDRAVGLAVDGGTLFWSCPNAAAEQRIVMLQLSAPRPADATLAGVPIVKTAGTIDRTRRDEHYWASDAEGAIRKVAKFDRHDSSSNCAETGSDGRIRTFVRGIKRR